VRDYIIFNRNEDWEAVQARIQPILAMIELRLKTASQGVSFSDEGVRIAATPLRALCYVRCNKTHYKLGRIQSYFAEGEQRKAARQKTGVSLPLERFIDRHQEIRIYIPEEVYFEEWVFQDMALPDLTP
jgi:hypothetical protein